MVMNGPIPTPHSPQPSRRCYRSRWERLLGQCESQIESDLLAVLCPMAIEHGYAVGKTERAANETLVVVPQAWIDTYRADFLIRFAFFGAELRIIVEADGHDWHERTKSQARRDRRRDRDLQALGYEVMRFTGSEIRADARLCAAEIMDVVMTWQTAEVVRHAPEQWGQ